jgi:hypothetical protein
MDIFNHLSTSTLGYLDPGTINVVVQFIIGGIVAVSIALRVFWTKIKIFFMKIFGKKKVEEIKADKKD